MLPRPMRALLILLLLLPTTVLAQSPDARLFVFGTAGIGSLGDDEGGLGKGLALAGSFGVALTNSVRAELSVARVHHERAGGIAWEGDATTVTGRLLYHFGSRSSRARVFAGGGAGYTHYPGAITSMVFGSFDASPRGIERFAFTINGPSYEGGGGVEIALGARAFLRPEAWVTIADGSRTSGTRSPEPPLFIARAAIGAGWRF